MYICVNSTKILWRENPIISMTKVCQISQNYLMKWNLMTQQRNATHINSVSITQQFYNRLPIRKKYIRAIKRGTLIYDHGQVKIPPIKIEGYDLPKKCQPPNYQGTGRVYKGRFEKIRAKRVCFAD